MWHKLPFREFIVAEMKRPAFQPFFLGAMTTFFGLGVGLNLGITDEARKESNYHKLFVLGQIKGDHH
ncbi:unnamed protein product [Heterosigma akashiwo]|eukprot:CAMPEP_0194574596 /NCGR_PEP_ID=MMETSP0292-20121207/10387_1 /TAXON_ID=39354 /ORGANISM="Heterosigma akashiwo, Strain CCMP2393" /LENGTH=66 /DNA_ID=CAMNT_0039426155 /DNA_START=177 /DNA_END=377 /DNA_ORIENTATION=-